MVARFCSKSFKLGLHSTRTENFQMYKLDLEKSEEPEIKSPTSVWSYRKQESSTKPSTSVSITTLKPLTIWITTSCGKFLKRWKHQTTLHVSWETCMQAKKLSNWTLNNTGSKLGKEYIKAVYCQPTYLTYVQSTSWETLGWMTHKVKSRLPVCSVVFTSLRTHEL